MKKQFITLTINGDQREVAILPHQTLLEVIRETIGLTGTKSGCTCGSCGVCTVINGDGEAVLSCMSLALEWDGASVTTIEGVEQNGELHPLQKSFLEYGAVQCGYCTPGLIMSAKALIDEFPDPTEQQINEAMAGAICRCTGHIKVKHAIRHVKDFVKDTQDGA